VAGMAVAHARRRRRSLAWLPNLPPPGRQLPVLLAGGPLGGRGRPAGDGFERCGDD
jgi:hypothetical protein